MTKKITYTDAFNELQEIVKDIENSEISIDSLDEKVKRASYLLKICREKLYKTEENVLSSLEDLKSE